MYVEVSYRDNIVQKHFVYGFYQLSCISKNTGPFQVVCNISICSYFVSLFHFKNLGMFEIIGTVQKSEGKTHAH